MAYDNTKRRLHAHGWYEERLKDYTIKVSHLGFVLELLLLGFSGWKMGQCVSRSMGSAAKERSVGLMAMAKEKRSRFYIARRCVMMLLCWHKHGKYWSPSLSLPLSLSPSLFQFSGSKCNWGGMYKHMTRSFSWTKKKRLWGKLFHSSVLVLVPCSIIHSWPWRNGTFVWISTWTRFSSNVSFKIFTYRILSKKKSIIKSETVTSEHERSKVDHFVINPDLCKDPILLVLGQ